MSWLDLREERKAQGLPVGHFWDKEMLSKHFAHCSKNQLDQDAECTCDEDPTTK